MKKNPKWDMMKKLLFLLEGTWFIAGVSMMVEMYKVSPPCYCNLQVCTAPPSYCFNRWVFMLITGIIIQVFRYHQNKRDKRYKKSRRSFKQDVQYG